MAEARKAEDDGLTFAQIFSEVDTCFSKGAKLSTRAKLENICLKSPYGTKLTMKEYETFDAEFWLLKSECRDVSEEETKRLYERALPRFLIESLHKELLRREDQLLVLVHPTVQQSAELTKTWLERYLHVDFRKASRKGLGTILHCRSAAQQSQVLALNGRTTSDGQVIKVETQDPVLSLEEMRAICRRTLQPRERADEVLHPIKAQHQAQVALIEAHGQ